MRALLIDDDAGSRRLGELLLAHLGWDVSCATSVAETHRVLQEVPACDLILLDCNFPDGDARDLISPLRIQYPDVPIVALTGRLEQDAAEMASFDAILTKPIDTRSFAKQVSELVNLRRDSARIEGNGSDPDR
jgi:CheY-like chemotaxis protein